MSSHHSKSRVCLLCDALTALGIMQEMITTTANDSSAEFVACIRRGPFAIPEEVEKIEYLLSRKRTVRAPAERHALYHVISYQRRVHAIKHLFFNRAKKTPIGRLIDWWDRVRLSCHNFCVNASRCPEQHTHSPLCCSLRNGGPAARRPA